MLDYKDIIIKHYGLGMSGREIAKLLGISKSGVNDFLAAFKKCDTLSFPLPEGITNYAIANHVYGPPQPSHGRDAGFVLPDFEEIHKSMSSRKNMTLVYLWNDKLRKRRYPMNHRKMPSLSEMERIEQSLLGEKLDEMLDRIEKEDIAYVITEGGKDKLVLCPYRWFEENFPDDVGYVVNSAIRQILLMEQTARVNHEGSSDGSKPLFRDEDGRRLAPQRYQATVKEVLSGIIHDGARLDFVLRGKALGKTSKVDVSHGNILRSTAEYYYRNVCRANASEIGALMGKDRVHTFAVSYPVSELYEQQKYMYDNHTHHVNDRIVSVSQPFVRPIVRGKAGKPVEFGAKLDISVVDGWTRLECCSFDAYNEAGNLQEMAERFREREGHYPSRILADRIYRNRENLNYCKEHGIRLSGPALGRPRKGETRDKAQDYRDECERVEVERRLSLAKRKCGMGLVTAKLRETSAHVIAMSALVLNLRKIQCAILQLLAFLRAILSPKQKWAIVQ